MYVDDEIISAAAQLIEGAISDGLPVDDMAEFHNFDTAGAHILQDVLDELDWADLTNALRAAADRLPEPKFGDEAEVPA